MGVDYQARDEQRARQADRQAARERYHRVLRTVAHNTGDPQPPAARLSSIGLTLVAHGPMSRSDYRSALQAAEENHDLLRLVDPQDGTTRRLALVTEPDLRAVVDWLAEHDHERQLLALVMWLADHQPDWDDVIGHANAALQEVRANE
ncbi:hypothetical protein SAMN05216388_101744 [Halorientalis persicus]|uniref:Uncharacterized protein n=1 Tax=Halorientalis persicus TaxID=1367881 RepID=A0A1H8RU44_9EURY|nr:hypothetical protein [Halorientalis persicus]SEO70189.1 hypothetical protein SAMN05216388_101744 [Halorientalis persicus]